MSRTRGDRCHRAGPTHLDRSVYVAAQHAFDIAMRPDKRLQPVHAFEQPGRIERRDADVERRMMHEQQRRPVAFR